MKGNAIVFMSIYLSFALAVAIVLNNYKQEKQTSKPTHYHATCTDDIFNGEVIKKGKKYYLDSGQEIWVPLKECVLVEL